MRITIEIAPSDPKPSVKIERTEGRALAENATNAGGPPGFLVEALGGRKEPEPEAAHALEQDAGPGPAWPVERTEAFISLPHPSGNGA